MIGAYTILTVLALVSFLVGVIDYPPVSSSRCIALGLFLLTLAQIIGK